MTSIRPRGDSVGKAMGWKDFGKGWKAFQILSTQDAPSYSSLVDSLVRQTDFIVIPLPLDSYTCFIIMVLHFLRKRNQTVTMDRK